MCDLTVGMDLVDVAGFRELLTDPASSFAERVFTQHELAMSDRLAGGRREQHLAGRFAAKEALVKAWSAALPSGAPITAQTRVWRAIEVRSDSYGRPLMVLHDPVSGAIAASLGPVRTRVSITHEPAMAGAVVILQLDHKRRSE